MKLNIDLGNRCYSSQWYESGSVFWMHLYELPFTVAYHAMLASHVQHHKAVASGICLLYRAKAKNKLWLIDMHLLTLNVFHYHWLEEHSQKIDFTVRSFWEKLRCFTWHLFSGYWLSQILLSLGHFLHLVGDFSETLEMTEGISWSLAKLRQLDLLEYLWNKVLISSLNFTKYKLLVDMFVRKKPFKFKVRLKRKEMKFSGISL